MTDIAGVTHDRGILVGYDGSPESERALAHAAELAHAWTASVSVISIADPIYRSPPYSGYADPGEADAHRRLLEEASRKLADRGIAANTIERTGEAAEAIGGAARETGAELIVVGSRDRSLLERLLLGSVSGELVVEAPCDVLVVR